jgi:hypothetical protein
MSFSERVEELNREIGATVERTVSDLRRRLTERLRASSEEILREVEALSPSMPQHFLAQEHVSPFADEASSNARQAAFSDLQDGLVAIDRSRSQTDVLTALLGATGSFASRSAVLLLRSGEVRGWGAHGFNGGADIRAVAFSAPTSGAWARLTQGQGAVRLTASEAADLCSQLESPLPHDSVVVPLVLRDQLAAVVYADSTGGDLNLSALQTLTYVAAQAIELLPLRERASTATLQLAEPGEAEAAEAPTAAHADLTAVEEPHPEAAGEEASAAAPEPEAEPQPEPEPEHAPESLLSSPQESHLEPEELPELPELEAEPEPAPQAAWQGRSTSETSEVRWPIEEAVGADELVELPEEVEATSWFGKTESWAVPVVEPEPPAPPTEPTPEAPEPEPPAAQPQDTVLLQRPHFEPSVPPAPEPSYPRPVAPISPLSPLVAPAGFEAAPSGSPASPAPSAAPANTNPEVRPPSDVDGPGWAFATTRVPISPDDAELHEQARRLARLLVSEIKLYNEDQVEEGRRNRDLYERLKEDIDRSRQMYEERVEPRVWKSTDYFYQELVRILAAGDSRALGI